METKLYAYHFKQDVACTCFDNTLLFEKDYVNGYDFIARRNYPNEHFSV